MTGLSLAIRKAAGGPLYNDTQQQREEFAAAHELVQKYGVPCEPTQ